MLVGIAIVVIFMSMVYRDKLEGVFKKWHLRIGEKDKK